MKILKPNFNCFKQINDFPYRENFIQYNDINMHYIDEGNGETILALHGEPTWSYLYRKFIAILSPHFRFVAPDFIGFGKSDKIVGLKNYSFGLHYHSLKYFIQQLNLKDITLVVHDWGGLLGLSILGERPELFKRVVIMNTFLPLGDPLPVTFKIWRALANWHPSLPVGTIIKSGTYQNVPKDALIAYKAPFPNNEHKAGAIAFPKLVPSKSTDEGVAEMKRAIEVLSTWQKPALVLFSDKDMIMSGLEKLFYKLIPSTHDQPKIKIKDAGHFLQEDKGEEIAEHIKKFILSS